MQTTEDQQEILRLRRNIAENMRAIKAHVAQHGTEEDKHYVKETDKILLGMGISTWKQTDGN